MRASTFASSAAPATIFWKRSAETPKEIVARLNATLLKIVREKDTQSYLAAQGLEPATSTPEELARIIRDEIPKFAKIVKAAGIKAE